MAAEDLTTLSPAQLNKMLKADIIVAILEGVTRTTRVFTYDIKGNVLRIDEPTTDAYGKTLGMRIIELTYYLGGEVDEITITDDKERIVVKHYTDGKRPIGTKRPIKPEPIPIPKEL